MTDSSPQLCARCVLDSRVPGVFFNDQGVCNTCVEFESYKEHLLTYFESETALQTRLAQWCRGTKKSEYQVLLLFSGGKDSTYALSRMLDFGVKILAGVFDNGYIAPVAMRNIETVCSALGVDKVVLRSDSMNEIFRESLSQDDQVCTGCSRAITSEAFDLAHQKGIPVIMDGFSRGQIVDKRLHKFFKIGIYDPDEIDAMLDEFIRVIHLRTDRVGELLARPSFHSPELFDQVRYTHFFRYSGVTNSDLLDYLKRRFPSWSIPPKVGSISTNCLIDDVGIHAHLIGRGFNMYAPETAWEVRLGHRGREEAIQSLSGEIDRQQVKQILKELENDESRSSIPSPNDGNEL